MGDGDKTPLRLQFNPKVRLEFHGATITSDAGLLPIRELDDALGLTHIAADYLQESRSGRNIRHHLVPLLRQSIYSRLAGYDGTNDAERLSQDPLRCGRVSMWTRRRPLRPRKPSVWPDCGPSAPLVPSSRTTWTTGRSAPRPRGRSLPPLRSEPADGTGARRV